MAQPTTEAELISRAAAGGAAYEARLIAAFDSQMATEAGQQEWERCVREAADAAAEAADLRRRRATFRQNLNALDLPKGACGSRDVLGLAGDALIAGTSIPARLAAAV